MGLLKTDTRRSCISSYTEMLIGEWGNEFKTARESLNEDLANPVNNGLC